MFLKRALCNCVKEWEIAVLLYNAKKKHNKGKKICKKKRWSKKIHLCLLIYAKLRGELKTKDTDDLQEMDGMGSTGKKWRRDDRHFSEYTFLHSSYFCNHVTNITKIYITWKDEGEISKMKNQINRTKWTKCNLRLIV